MKKLFIVFLIFMVTTPTFAASKFPIRVEGQSNSVDGDSLIYNINQFFDNCATYYIAQKDAPHAKILINTFKNPNNLKGECFYSVTWVWFNSKDEPLIYLHTITGIYNYELIKTINSIVSATNDVVTNLRDYMSSSKN